MMEQPAVGQESPREGHPPAPWRLRGTGFLFLQRFDLRRARMFVPAEATVLPVGPRQALGGMYLARYGHGSTLRYHELIVVPAIVWCRGRPGAWVSHIYVDDPRSQAGGRSIWGLPKERADFDWAPAGQGEITVRQEQERHCTLRPGPRPAWSLRLPLLLPAFGRRKGMRLWLRGSGRALTGIARGRVEVPASSPFASLGFRRGTCMHLRELDLTVSAPVER